MINDRKLTAAFWMTIAILVLVALVAGLGLLLPSVYHQTAWGYVAAGFVLISAATMGIALLSMTIFAVRANLPVDATLSAAWVTLAWAGLPKSFWCFRHRAKYVGAASALN